MGSLNVSALSKNARSFLKKHGPEICTGLGIAFMVGSGVLAAVATPKVIRLIKEKKEEKETNSLSPLEIIKTAGPCYIPAVLSAAVGVSLLIGAGAESLRRTNALATMYSLSEKTLTKYKEKVVETVGDKKATEIKDAVSKDIIKEHPVRSSEVVVVEKGGTLCRERPCGRYFTMNIDKLRVIMREFNNEVRKYDSASLNDFYYKINLNPTDLGGRFGWNSSDIDGTDIELIFSSQLDDDYNPCLEFEFSPAPRYEFE